MKSNYQVQLSEITIDGRSIVDFDTFHSVFNDQMGFLDGYGNNMDAWVDCMRDIHEDTGMSNILLPNNVGLVIRIVGTVEMEKVCANVLDVLVSSTAFVNNYLKQFDQAVIYLEFE